MTINLDEMDGQWSLTFYTGELPADAAVQASGHEPNGYFWEGIVQYAWPRIADRLEFDSEAGMFAVYGEQADLEAIREAMTPVITNPATVRDLIDRADASGFEFDD
jgi:hypothetical protein